MQDWRDGLFWARKCPYEIVLVLHINMYLFLAFQFWIRLFSLLSITKGKILSALVNNILMIILKVK